jgi:hypothetical protein
MNLGYYYLGTVLLDLNLFVLFILNSYDDGVFVDGGVGQLGLEPFCVHFLII